MQTVTHRDILGGMQTSNFTTDIYDQQHFFHYTFISPLPWCSIRKNIFLSRLPSSLPAPPSCQTELHYDIMTTVPIFKNQGAVTTWAGTLGGMKLPALSCVIGEGELTLCGGAFVLLLHTFVWIQRRRHLRAAAVTRLSEDTLEFPNELFIVELKNQEIWWRLCLHGM